MACWDASRKSKTSRASCAPKPCWPTKRAPRGARRCVRIRTDAPPAGHARPRGHADPVGARAADRGRQAVRSRSALQPAQLADSGRPGRDRGPGSRAKADPGRIRRKIRTARHRAGRTAGRPRRRTDRVPQQGTGAGRRAKKLRELERAAQEAQFAEKSQRSKIEELRRNIATATQQAAQVGESIEMGQQELDTLETGAANDGLQDLLDRRTGQERALSDARHELDQITQQLRTAEESRMQAERSLQPQRDKITEMQLKEQAARLNQEQFAEALKAVDADEAALSEKLHADMKPQYLQGEVTRLTNAIAALGAVNLAALDELAQASERKNFLDAQNKDLVEAITTLEDAISRIDKETRELLQDTFDRVNHHFSELFPILFGGGNAKLVMTGDEILDSGVQVMAQPPGKKNATIHLLSGGEKR
ncbi:hypothetical protein LP419_37140 [Massilia sp. H-1]|nr:hypothetical protein LP419_37140 [Massilia sp. H-1]